MYPLGSEEIAMLAVNGFGAMQKIPEFASLVAMVDAAPHQVIMEIGAGKGGSAWAWSKLTDSDLLIVVDLPGGPWGGGPSKEAIEYIARMAPIKLDFLAGNSANSECLSTVKKRLDGAEIDFLFIDGDHSYEGVKTDFITYSPLVKKGGLIALHDICEHEAATKCEVKKFWDELKETWPKDLVTEFVSEPSNWGGIGVVRTA
jgi:cephalosporin hydroxylase